MIDIAQPGSTFEAVAREWHKRKSPGWHSADYAADVMSQLENWVFRHLGHADIRAIRPAEMLAVLRRIEDAGFLSTAHRVCKTCSAVFVFGIASERAEIDPAAMVRLALTASRVTPRRAVTSLAEVRALLHAVEKLDCIPIFKLAMRFLAITTARPAMVLGATWDEIKATGANIPTWRVPKERMKMRDECVSPLPGAALDILAAVKPFRVDRFVFPDWHQSNQDRPLAANCFNRVLERAGWHDRHSAHGFRSSFSTIMNDRPGAQPGDENAIEAQLAHKLPGVKGIYNRGRYIERRSEIVSEWSSLILDGAPDAIWLAGYALPSAAA